jgi:hypothetical protein
MGMTTQWSPEGINEEDCVLRDSAKLTRRTFRPNPQRLEQLDFEILLAQFWDLSLSQDCRFLIPVTPDRAQHFGLPSLTSSVAEPWSPLFQRDIPSLINEQNHFLDSPQLTSVAIPNPHTVFEQLDTSLTTRVSPPPLFLVPSHTCHLIQIHISL